MGRGSRTGDDLERLERSASAVSRESMLSWSFSRAIGEGVWAEGRLRPKGVSKNKSRTPTPPSPAHLSRVRLLLSFFGPSLLFLLLLKTLSICFRAAPGECLRRKLTTSFCKGGLGIAEGGLALPSANRALSSSNIFSPAPSTSHYFAWHTLLGSS